MGRTGGAGSTAGPVVGGRLGEGSGVGETVGKTVGETVGETGGETGGEIVGKGEAAGGLAGRVVGETVGERVGEIGGEMVGKTVGESVGVTLGAGRLSLGASAAQGSPVTQPTQQLMEQKLGRSSQRRERVTISTASPKAPSAQRAMPPHLAPLIIRAVPTIREIAIASTG